MCRCTRHAKITEKVARVNQKMPLFYKSLSNLINAVAVSELVKTIAKLEGEYKAADLN
jgi:hypothetical protein